MGSLEQNTTLIYGIHIRESANDGSDFSNGASDYRVLFLGEDGDLHLKDSAGTVTDIGGGGGSSVTSGEALCSADTAIGSAGWTDVSGVTLSLADGTYNIFWKALTTAAGQRSVFAQVLQGSTVIDEEEEAIEAAGFRTSMSGFAMNVVLTGGPTTVKLQMRADASSTVKRNGGQSANHHPTKIGWMKIA